MIDLTHADVNVENMSTGLKTMIGVNKSEDGKGTSLPVEFINSLLLELCGLIQWSSPRYYEAEIHRRFVPGECDQLVKAIFGRYLIKNIVKYELNAKLVCWTEAPFTPLGKVDYLWERRREDIAVNFKEGFIIDTYWKHTGIKYKLIFCDATGTNYSYADIPSVWKEFGCVYCYGIKRYHNDDEDKIFPIAIYSYFDDSGLNGWLEILNLDTGEPMAMKEIPFKSNDVKTIKDIADEINNLQGISHENLVKFFGAELHRVKHFISIKLNFKYFS